MRLSRAHWGMVAGACLLLLAVPDRTVLGQEGDPVSQGNERTQQLRAELNKKLNQPVDAKFNEVMLRDAVAMIAEEIEADVVFDRPSIDEETLTVDNPVTLEINRTRLSAREILDLILSPEGLEAVNHNGILMVTSAGRAEEMLYLHVYDVRDLIDEAAKSIELHPLPKCDCPEDKDDASSDEETESQEQTSRPTGSVTTFRSIGGMGGIPQWSLSDCLARFGGPRMMATSAIAQLIQELSPGPWMDIEGAGGTIRPYQGRLIVRQTERNHAEIQKILDGLRAEKGARAKDDEVKEEKSEEIDPAAGASPLPVDADPDSERLEQ